MKAPEEYDDNDMPWDVKTVKIERGEHVRGFDTVKEAMADVRAAQQCDCPVCK